MGLKDSVYIAEIINYLEAFAPPELQESYDNSGLQTGNGYDITEGVLVTIDVTEAVLDEAVRKGANLIISHHPLIFGGIKRLTGTHPVERILIKAIRNNLAIYSAHTNLDSITGGVNTKIADLLGLQNQKILQPARSVLRKLVTYVPTEHLDRVRNAVFEAGAGHIGNYDSCSFNTPGTGTFRGNDTTNPFAGESGKFHNEPEIRIETVFPAWLENNIVGALTAAHPYEEVAYDIYSLENIYPKAGAGLIGQLPEETEEKELLAVLKNLFSVPVIRHSPLLGKPVKSVAVCGGSGSFLIRNAISAGAGIFITADIKYHQFFDADNKILIADIGHHESEQFTKELFHELLTKKFSTFAVHLSEVNTNPVNYF
jgi:dinuclear metal center YbgI/SA1388 family protein